MKKLKSKLESTNTDSFGVSGSDFTRTQKSHRQFLVMSTMKMQTESADQLKLDLPPVVNLPFQNKIRSQKRSRNQIRTSDLFNVYRAPQTLATNPESLLKKKRQYQISQSIIKYYSDEITTLKDQQSLDDQEIENSISKYLNEAIQSLDVLIKKIQNLLQYKQNREKSEQEMKEIMQECFKQKNLCIQQRFCYIFGKMEQLFFNPLSGAIYFKLCKRLSDNEVFYRNKMKAYRGLGECLLRVRPKLSQLYFTKYLMSAWKLNEKNHELYAYDLLGKYYFYVGQIEKAKLFHEKMIGGYCEVCNINYHCRFLSPELGYWLRVVQNRGAYQIELIGNIRLSTQMLYCSFIQSIQYNLRNNTITSDDECYEIVLTQPQQIKVATVSSVKYFQRKIPDPKSVKEEANTNIRQKKPKYNSQLLEIGGEFDMSKLVISNPHLNIGAIKDRVLLSHMSPNRKLEMYQYLCLASDKNAFNNVNLLSGLYDRFEISKINKYLTKLISLLSTVQQWLTSQQKHKHVTRRFALV